MKRTDVKINRQMTGCYSSRMCGYAALHMVTQPYDGSTRVASGWSAIRCNEQSAIHYNGHTVVCLNVGTGKQIDRRRFGHSTGQTTGSIADYPHRQTCKWRTNRMIVHLSLQIVVPPFIYHNNSNFKLKANEKRNIVCRLFDTERRRRENDIDCAYSLM
jgi:hypothetical protein